jgi:hypothetical protein
MTTLAAPFSHLDTPPAALDATGVPGRSYVPPIAGKAQTFADRCAVLALDLRTALEDRLPTLAALATFWFDAEDDDDASGDSEVPPRDAVCVRIDLNVFAAGLMRRDGYTATPEDAAEWLAAVGFQHFGNLWVGEREDLRLIGTLGVEPVAAGGNARGLGAVVNPDDEPAIPWERPIDHTSTAVTS